ncbi:signal peptidase II [Paraclostridium sordellii]|uniref:Lipoprotein signal peptidase n=1 Tax=Paraclostridium sordellii TaxID=1505 RepID=A0A0C7PR26_PARSO|nr:signal peptidase II [Paeniclostridium sordellii]CEN79831.1 lipoprotein signal peptidase [[Clostridium] sordellii] [Paeniclostridium sordellii]CEO12516.1 lipoprotein signal peptidase [[Clostridium] sordellii] [Paeniclostridium sordellii]CEP81640.1 lipoprotein signal peptidase [[Clostridium] sordellii] [Paeniclostridium sordellii]CEP87878.1 lipoprotein signal peptidase [[Clostridium] sordellii] [Paeniclostridium sordellii]CEP97386.1 lipoprotein signal peptidase [[Clostridium] sordellii] [Paen
MLYILIIIGLIAIDQISKYLAVNYLANIGSIPIIKNVFHLTYVENRGAAFGMFQNNQIIFIVVAIAACVFGLYYLYKKDLNVLGKSAIILIISGALGNLIDRIRLGFVVDYFDFRVIWDYVFNVADVFVVVGTILLCVYIIFFENDK